MATSQGSHETGEKAVWNLLQQEHAKDTVRYVTHVRLERTATSSTSSLKTQTKRATSPKKQKQKRKIFHKKKKKKKKKPTLT